jgi:tRNA dimethylallyltransferase
MTKDSATIHIICGPTASGKSARAIELAREQNGVIINCDSMQIYNDLPLLTAQPSDADKAEAPHELYATLHPNEGCSAGHWREMVEPLIERVLENGKTPIVCGGTGLYIRALTDGLSPMPEIPDEVRVASVKLQAELGNPAFHAELEKLDPVMAERFHPHHTARIIRAHEVITGTGKSLAEWQKLDRTPPPEHWNFNIEKVLPDRTTLYERCNARFLWMMDNGALEEVEAFSDKIERGEVRPDIPLAKALGFKPLRAYLNGEMSKEDAIDRAQTDTRQYAKRQNTWFTNQT